MTLLLALKSPLLDLYRGRGKPSIITESFSPSGINTFLQPTDLTFSEGSFSPQTAEGKILQGSAVALNHGSSGDVSMSPASSGEYLRELAQQRQILWQWKINLPFLTFSGKVIHLLALVKTSYLSSPFCCYLWVISPVTLFIGSEVIRNHALRVCTQTGHPKRPLCIKFLIVWHKFSLSLSLRQESSHLFTNRLRPSPCF